MYKQVSPSVRNTAVVARSLAIMGRLPDALSRIEECRREGASFSALDAVALWMVEAELRHLDAQDAEALDLFDTKIGPYLPELPDQVVIIIARNRSDVSLSLFKPDDFYGIVDHGRQAGVELWRNEALFDAMNAASEGEYFKSLPAIWRELHRSYVQGCWGPYRFASLHMAKQCLQLGLVSEAAFHAIISRDEKAAKEVGEHMLRVAPKESLVKAIDTLRTCGHLQRHFVAASHALRQTADAIPDEMLEPVFVWLLEHAKLSSVSLGIRQAMEAAWETLEALAFRLDDGQANRLVAVASEHPSWLTLPEKPSQVVPVRQTMVRAIGRATCRIKASTASTIANHVLPLATDRRQHLDYSDAIETLCQLAARGGNRLKERLRKALYLKGERINAVLLQVSHVFDQPPKKPETLAQDAERVAQNLRLQVQRLPIDAQPQPVYGTMFTITSERGAEKLIVHMAQPMHVFAIFRHRATLPPASLSSLIDSVLDMIREPENVLANKIGLVRSLAHVGDVCSKSMAGRILDALMPLARGEITEPSCVMSAAEAANPLNPFKLGSGKPNELRAVSIFTLACLARDNRGLSPNVVNDLIAVAMSDGDSTVQSMTLAAAREMPRLSNSVFTGALLASRDPDPIVASTAFGTIAKALSSSHDEDTWRLVTQSLQFASRSADVRVRRSVASTVSRILQGVCASAIRNELKLLRDQFAQDRCYSVRQAARRK